MRIQHTHPLLLLLYKDAHCIAIPMLCVYIYIWMNTNICTHLNWQTTHGCTLHELFRIAWSMQQQRVCIVSPGSLAADDCYYISFIYIHIYYFIIIMYGNLCVIVYTFIIQHPLRFSLVEFI